MDAVDSNPPRMAVVIMGVCGSGKSTIGNLLAKALNCRFLDADDFHPESNKDKMKRGIALSDKDRIPWLEILRNALREQLLSENIVVLGCSALHKDYREILRSSDPNYVLGSFDSMVKFVLLDARAEVIAARLEKRAAEGNHFMPPSLLQSQLDSLQLDPSEGILKVDAAHSPNDLVNGIQALIFGQKLGVIEPELLPHDIYSCHTGSEKETIGMAQAQMTTFTGI